MNIPQKPLKGVSDTSLTLPRYAAAIDSEPPHQSKIPTSNSMSKVVDDSATETTSLTSALTKIDTIKINKNSYSWTWEILAVVVSIAALITVTVLLSVYDGKPLATWHSFFTFNTIISVLGTVSRASLAFAIGGCLSQGKWNWFRRKQDYITNYDRFEEAGRGPLGSARLLWHMKHRHWVSLGALAAVVLLGFESFLQAVVELYEKEVESSDPGIMASIGRTQRLDFGKANFRGDSAIGLEKMPEPWGSIRFQSMFDEYDYGSLSAIWTAFNDLNSYSTQQPSFTCATGNCTWPPHASLAVCSACNDISSNLEKSTGYAHPTDRALLTVPWSITYAVYKDDDRRAYTKFQLPTMDLNISNFDSDFGQQVEFTAQVTTRPGSTLSFQDSKTLIASFAMMKRDTTKTGNKTVGGATALECALSFCTNIYRSTVTKGILKEDLIGSYTIRNLDSFLSSPVGEVIEDEKVKVYNEMTNYTLYYSVGFERTDLQLIIPPDDDIVTLIGNNGLRFNISQAAATTLPSAFVRKFARRSGDLASKQLIYPTFETLEPEQPSVITTLGKSQNLTATFEMAALGLTKWMRDVSLLTDPHVGTTKESVVHIRVRWGFMSLPYGALLVGCLFCLFSILETRRLRLPAWKGSSLAGLTHGLDTETREQLRGAEDISKHARHVKIRMVNSTSGPELVSSSNPIRTRTQLAPLTPER